MDKRRMIQTIRLFLARGNAARGRYLKKNKIFAEMGENVRFQPRLIPLYPELIKFHNNIVIAAGVRLITHDASYAVLNRLGRGKFPEPVGCIEIMDNVFIGYNSTILPNVRIGENVIVGACSVVAGDLEPNGVYVGSPAKKIGSFDDFVAKRSKIHEEFAYPYVEHNQRITKEEIQRAWKLFSAERSKTMFNM